jgi:phosphoribosyl-AMP cyclohydrolase
MSNATQIRFNSRESVQQVEEGYSFAPKFDCEGLIPCVTTDAQSREVLMLGYMNEDALRSTIATGQAHYWSRSRQQLWHKGATSGLTQTVVEMRVDDDQDAIWLSVAVQRSAQSEPASCHVGFRSCFYRVVEMGTAKIRFTETRKVFDPRVVYGDAPNPTVL